MERAGRLFGKLRIPAGSVSPEELARAAWPSAVGKKIAGRSNPVSLVRGCLLVEVEDAVWQRQLTTMRQQIVQRLREVTGTGVIEEIAFRPMVPKRSPQRAEAVRQTFLLSGDDADTIDDPIFRNVYIRSRKKASA